MQVFKRMLGCYTFMLQALKLGLNSYQLMPNRSPYSSRMSAKYPNNREVAATMGLANKLVYWARSLLVQAVAFVWVSV